MGAFSTYVYRALHDALYLIHIYIIRNSAVVPITVLFLRRYHQRVQLYLPAPILVSFPLLKKLNDCNLTLLLLF